MNPTDAKDTVDSMANAHRSFEQLFWPAVAGNVAWSLYSVAIPSPGEIQTEIGSRFCSLLLLAWYSWYGWLRFTTIPYRSPSYYWVDGLHLITLAAFAVATASHNLWTPYFLVAVFVVAGIGHLCGSFDRRPDERVRERLKRAGANAIGVAVLLASPRVGISQGWSVPLAFVLVLLVWWQVHGLSPRPRRTAA